MAPAAADGLADSYVWPENKRPAFEAGKPLNLPVIDLAGFLSGDEGSTQNAAELIAGACRKHGFFQVKNHGVDASLFDAIIKETEGFFSLPLGVKERIRGFTDSHNKRFKTSLPWTETLTTQFLGSNTNRTQISFPPLQGYDVVSMGGVLNKYGEAMLDLCHQLLELLAISLGLERELFSRFYQDSDSLLRCNFYPSCDQPDLTLGTGPHADPTSLTVLYQTNVEGLQVYTDGKWRLVAPVPGALVINIGDTFMALTNGRYKSCLHRAVVNKETNRYSVAFFLNPQKQRTVKAPEELVHRDGRRVYPDFTWADYLNFTQTQYRADLETLNAYMSSKACA